MKAYELDKNGYYIGDIPFFTEENKPAYYTLVPMTKSFFKPKFNGTKWVEGDTRENYIGTTVYSISDKSALVITQLGPIPDGYTVQVPKEFDYWDGSLWITDIALRNATLKKRKLAEINHDLEVALSVLRSEYPESEIMTWNKQESEARAWMRDNTRPTPLVDLIASQRNIDKVLLINKIIEKSDQYAYAVGSAIGRRQMLEDKVKSVAVGQESKLDQIKF